MPRPFIGELRMFGFTFAPKGWALCEGQIMSISEYPALYSLLGTAYGGDGRATFCLPDLRGRAPMHRSSAHRLGRKTGVEAVQLVLDNAPGPGQASTNTPAMAVRPTVGSLAEPSHRLAAIYPAVGTTTMLRSESISITGGARHNNMQPFLAINWALAIHGDFPARN